MIKAFKINYDLKDHSMVMSLFSKCIIWMIITHDEDMLPFLFFMRVIN